MTITRASTPDWRAAKKYLCERCGAELFCNAGGFKGHLKACNPFRALHLFWSKVERRGDDQCWGWTGHTRWDGYGRFRHLRKAVFAHRFSYELHNGKIPAGMHVLHSCDNPICTNPKHLRLGTHSENMRDMHGKGRGWHGGNRRKEGPTVGKP